MGMDTEAAAAIADPTERARTINRLIDEHTEAINSLSPLRKAALEELIATGMTQQQIADKLDMTRSRVSQILTQNTKVERAFLGSGKLTVAIGSKLESGRSDPGGVVSTESFSAFEKIADLARSVGLDASFETVPPPGLVHLNRPNLIVLTNPRLLPFLSQVMEADPHLRYMSDDKGWYLVDVTAGVEYRSPRDSGEQQDYGYIGRLPRPDGKGTFLYLAGLHAQGTLGAAHFLAANIGDLHKELKNKRFSLVMSCRYDGGVTPPKILSTKRVTQIYRHEGA
jgi:predicted XRE-type DNA-binding protein